MFLVPTITWKTIGTTAVLFLLLSMGCQQQMALQPSYRPLEPSDFFADGRSARPILKGTIARGQLTDLVLRNAADGEGRSAVPAASLVSGAASGALSLLPILEPDIAAIAVADYTTLFPFPVTVDVLQRGKDRYGIFCAVCHDPSGNGNGKIVERGYTRPPSYVTDFSRGFERRGIKILLRKVPVGYYFEVVSNGFGAMPDYASQIPPRDRWAIIAYIRALQFSQWTTLDELPADEREKASKGLEESR